MNCIQHLDEFRSLTTVGQPVSHSYSGTCDLVHALPGSSHARDVGYYAAIRPPLNITENDWLH